MLLRIDMGHGHKNWGHLGIGWEEVFAIVCPCTLRTNCVCCITWYYMRLFYSEEIPIAGILQLRIPNRFSKRRLGGQHWQCNSNLAGISGTKGRGLNWHEETHRTRCTRATLWVDEGSVVQGYKKIHQGPGPNDWVGGPATAWEKMTLATSIRRYTTKVVFALHRAYVSCHASGYAWCYCSAVVVVGCLKGQVDIWSDIKKSSATSTETHGKYLGNLQRQEFSWIFVPSCHGKHVDIMLVKFFFR